MDITASLSPVQSSALDAIGGAQARSDRALARAASGNLDAATALDVTSAGLAVELAATLIKTESDLHKRLLDVTV